MVNEILLQIGSDHSLYCTICTKLFSLKAQYAGPYGGGGVFGGGPYGASPYGASPYGASQYGASQYGLGGGLLGGSLYNPAGVYGGLQGYNPFGASYLQGMNPYGQFGSGFGFPSYGGFGNPQFGGGFGGGFGGFPGYNQFGFNARVKK